MISKETQSLLDDIKPIAERFIKDFSDVVLKQICNEIRIRDHVFIWKNGDIYSYVNTDHCIDISIIEISTTNIVMLFNTIMYFVEFSENKVIEVGYDSIENLQAIKEILEKINEYKDWRYYVDND